ncbi:response regulator [Sphingomonas canadensis]|uniref:histidine kinase n=1 Tax=Sphingomonas canadensis TaxID=1219257 RepID=A0ABW3H1N3_9SPHN|nr:response regulator [Sphingomonas canadensis]MCW3834732.1 response regulator [Sphingomonas canadensis]
MTRQVLIVDDSLTVRMGLADALEAAGIASTACATLAEARAALARDPFAVAILDVLLPDGDGIALLAEIRADPAREGMRVMLLSSEAEVKDRLRGLRTGADEYVGKPYDTSYVVARVGEFLQQAAPAAAAEAQTVLVIDDSPTFRARLGEALVEAGYSVRLAASGEEGLRLAAAAPPSAVIVDGVMPGFDGPAVLRRIRMDAALRHLPCILLTATTDPGAEVRALDAGADAFVRKDEDFALLLARLGAVIRSVDGPRVGEEEARSLMGPQRILTVDDSETYLQQLGADLRAEGFDVVFARSGEEALELLAAQPVDCILLDLVMPGIGGHEACRRIKATPILQRIPVIMLTALKDRESMVRGLDAGADDYVDKAADFEVLRSRVRAQLRRKQFEDQNRVIRERLAQKELEAIEARAAREMAAMQAVLEERRRNEREMAKLQAELAHVSRWNAMGMIAGTIAHELNQPLTAATNFLHALDRVLARAEHPEAASASEMVGHTAAQLRQAGAIIGNLREFIERRETGRTIEDLNRVVQEAIALGAFNAAQTDAEIEVRFEQALPPVLINKVEIQQVLVNLFRNAFDAMRGAHRRVLTVATAAEDGDFATVAISDTGPGIPPQVMRRLFQPFTTTKAQGMGLGLKISQSIIEAHQGKIWITPNRAEGVTFRFRLPAVEMPDR